MCNQRKWKYQIVIRTKSESVIPFQQVKKLSYKPDKMIIQLPVGIEPNPWTRFSNTLVLQTLLKTNAVLQHSTETQQSSEGVAQVLGSDLQHSKTSVPVNQQRALFIEILQSHTSNSGRRKHALLFRKISWSYHSSSSHCYSSQFLRQQHLK